jgi:hypothetical protein
VEVTGIAIAGAESVMNKSLRFKGNVNQLYIKADSKLFSDIVSNDKIAENNKSDKIKDNNYKEEKPVDGEYHGDELILNDDHSRVPLPETVYENNGDEVKEAVPHFFEECGKFIKNAWHDIKIFFSF